MSKGQVTESKILSRRKSGRFWKADRDRFRSVIKSKGLKQSFDQRKKAKEAQIRAREYEKSLKEATKQKKEDLRMRQEENNKKRLEAQRKNEVVQEVTF